MTVAVPEKVIQRRRVVQGQVTSRRDEVARPRPRARRPYEARTRPVGGGRGRGGGVPLGQTPASPFRRLPRDYERRVQRAGNRDYRVSVPPGGGGPNYRGVILTEFVVAVLFVSFAPLARGPGKKKPGLSPYTAGDMWRFLAIGGTYFGLAMLSAAGRVPARWAAWFGGLVLLAILFQQTQSGDLQNVFVTLSHGQAAKQDQQLGAGVAAGAETGLGVGG